ncbi:hypothetical protein [Arthrobacter sp. MYb213]|uniref:hypothetical protein n=1 Tax=Arthrobacter sp. MYb213 TaxID=1848595 RepID=UPI000CFBC6FC|nr:hypothetical protein [Arthrobacter sp. MYb213]PRB69491.1 hypothetical protein CQ011_12070 [Arthrobacter sp. MYb213]
MIFAATPEKPDDSWVIPDFVLPIFIALLISFLVPAFVSWLGERAKGKADSRKIRMELVRDFIRSLAEYEAAFTLDSMENDKASEEAFNSGAKRFKGYFFKRVPAQANVRSCWRSILAQTQNLETDVVERKEQLALFSRSIAFMDKITRELDPRDVEHFPDVLGDWIKKGHMDFARLEANLDAITPTSSIQPVV